jgi:uncharacterized protein with FMN-binding domain
MKRILLTLIGTVAGIVSLLSFKTTSPQTSSGALPSAALPTTSTTPTSPSTSTSTTAPTTSGSSSQAKVATTSSYLGSAVTTRYGVVQVKVTVKAGRITNVAFRQLTAFDPHSQQINDQAAPQLLSETLSAQNAHIDTVSGATYTSDGYVQSLQNALDKAGIK